MKLINILSIAHSKQLNVLGLSKKELVQEIQKSEGHFNCYSTASKFECDQMDCVWREDCFAESRNACNCSNS